MDRPDPPPPSILLSLPNELIARVAAQTEASSLPDLNRTCKRLRDVTEEHQSSRLNEGRLARMETDGLKRLREQVTEELLSRAKKQKQEAKEASLEHARSDARLPRRTALSCAFTGGCGSTAQFRCGGCNASMCPKHIEEQLCQECRLFSACDNCVVTEPNWMGERYHCAIRICFHCCYEITSESMGDTQRLCFACADDFMGVEANKEV